MEVARRLGIPGGTARWRLKRGLDELRERLDADSGGERERWLPLLLPLLRRGPATRPARGPWTAPVPAGTMSMHRVGAAAKLALGALVLFCLFGAWRGWTAIRSREVNSAASWLYRSGELARAARSLATQTSSRQPVSLAAVLPAPGSCPEAQALEKERDALASAAEPLRNPQVLFEQSPRNPLDGALTARTEQLDTSWLSGFGRFEDMSNLEVNTFEPATGEGIDQPPPGLPGSDYAMPIAVVVRDRRGGEQWIVRTVTVARP